MEISDNNPGTPRKETMDNVNIFIGINIFIDDTITFNPYNTTNANTTFLTIFLTIVSIISSSINIMLF